MFLHREAVGGDLGIQVGFTDGSLDLGDRAPDPLGALALLGERLGVVPVIMRQVHGREVCDATVPPPEPPVADGLIARDRGVALLARAADCVPVLLVDGEVGVIGAAHAGRNGVVANVVGATVEAMRTAGGLDIQAWVGPHVCGRCYEVPEDLRAAVADAVPEAWATTRAGTPAVDLAAGVRAQLAAAGVTRVRDLEICTLEDDRLPSHRGGDAGRFAGVVWW